MIVVAGGSGRLGTLLVRRLVERPLPVRVLTRDPARASHLARLPIDIARADVRDATGLARAVAGADTIVSAVHGFAGPGGVSPESVDRDGNAHLVDAARAAGASLVLTSIVGAAPDSPLELFRAKYDAEQYLRRSGVPWTIVRATAFVETWATIVGDPRRRKRLMVLGRGDNPINFVSAADVAALLELVVVDAAFRGRIVEIGGPDNMTLNELAAAVQDAAGRRCAVGHVPRPALRAMGALMRVVNPMFARQARAAVAMDTHDLTFDAAPGRRLFPSVPATDVKTAVERHLRSDGATQPRDQGMAALRRNAAS